jgi:hypothetical protein
MKLDVLLLAADPGARDLVLGALGQCWVTVAASRGGHCTPGDPPLRARDHHQLRSAPGDAVAVIPVARDYPVLFLTGHLNPDLEAACRARAIPWLRVPVELDGLRRELRLALEDLGI